MKTTKSRMINIIIVGSVAVNLAVIGALSYIAHVNGKTDRLNAYLASPVVIYAPKSVATPETTALVEASPAK